jgi:hypothetical protein
MQSISSAGIYPIFALDANGLRMSASSTKGWPIRRSGRGQGARPSVAIRNGAKLLAQLLALVQIANHRISQKPLSVAVPGPLELIMAA